MEQEIWHFSPPPQPPTKEPQKCPFAEQQQNFPSNSRFKIIQDPLPTQPKAIDQLIFASQTTTTNETKQKNSSSLLCKIQRIKAELDEIEGMKSLPIDNEIELLQAQISRILCIHHQQMKKEDVENNTKRINNNESNLNTTKNNESNSIIINESNSIINNERNLTCSLEIDKLDAVYRKLKLIGLECDKARERRQISTALEVKINALWERLMGLEGNWNAIPLLHQRIRQFEGLLENSSSVQERLSTLRCNQQTFAQIAKELRNSVEVMQKEVEELKREIGK